MRAVLVTVVLAGACASRVPVNAVRFVNAPPVTVVNDRLDVPSPPAERIFARAAYELEAFYLMGQRTLALERSRRAHGVNAIDEVPDSTWFINRIGVRTVTADEIRTGSAPCGSPEAHLPWTIKSAQPGGSGLGFMVEDARGVRFLLKFDPPQLPELRTAADAIVPRLLWASGFHVPENHVVYFHPEQLRLAAGATARNRVGEKVPLTPGDVARQLATLSRTADGRIRGLASILIEGTPLGGIPRLGVRPDDRNDRIPHELRRDLRGQRSIFAWLDHTDVKEDNTLDMWRADPEDASIHYVTHYLLDFDNALGAHATSRRRYSVGYEYFVSPRDLVTSLFTLGLWPRRWEGRRDPQLRGVGLFEAEFDPGEWRPNSFGHYPLIFADRFDQFWGAKILIRFTRSQLAAAVEAGRYSDPRAAAYVLETLIARQRRTARHWFRKVAPIDEATVTGTADRSGGTARLCFTDLALRHRLETAATTYTVDSHDAAGAALAGTRSARASAAGDVCVASVPVASSAESYTILRVRSSRAVPETLIHIARDPDDGELRIVGIVRR